MHSFCRNIYIYLKTALGSGSQNIQDYYMTKGQFFLVWAGPYLIRLASPPCSLWAQQTLQGTFRWVGSTKSGSIHDVTTSHGGHLLTLTYWGQDKMVALSQTILSIAFFVNENVRISIKFSLKFVPKGPISKIPALVQIMAWHRPGDKPLPEPVMVSLLTHICVTRPQIIMHPTSTITITKTKPI